ncbi:MAG TPA: S8 family serine peptidase [Kofleriaceae bacterium]|nr:S8 family serine peptidase [Kofleriaceae bacterium]
MRLSTLRGCAAFLTCLAAGCASNEGPDDRDGHIDLASVSIDTRAIASASDEELNAPDGSGQYVLVQLAGPPTAADLAALRASVEQVYTYVPNNAFVVRVAPGSRVDRLGAWAGVVQPEYKIARGLRDAALAADEVEVQTIMVQAYPDADLQRIVGQAALEPEAEVVGVGKGERFSRVRLLVPSDRAVALAEKLAAVPEVFWIDAEARRTLFNDTTIWVGQSGVSGGQATPVFDHGIHGEGQVVGYIDTGADVDSCYYRDTARGLPPTNACNGGTAIDASQRKVLAVDFLWSNECAGGIGAGEWDTQNHGTHVGGIIAGDNFANPIEHDTADGMAPGAKLVVQDGGFGTDNCGDLPGIGCPVVDLQPLFQQAYDQGARLHTNSWGDQENASPQNNYTAASEDVDAFMFSHPDFLVFFAAGNSGPGTATVGSPSTAKNGVSVGATQRGTAAEAMAGFSSCGPTADNRIKPDLTIPGQSIISARNDTNVGTNNCNTISMSGTSMASPAAAGLGALVRQYYTDGFYPTGAAVTANRFTPSAALVKGTLLNSARQMTGAGVIPSNCQGWGRILLDDALFFPGQARTMFVADDSGFPSGGAGQTKTFNLAVQAGTSLKATLVWTDFPSTPAASVNLVNDLDLEVSGPSGTFRGNVFSGGVSQTGGSADRRNTVEQVLLASPAAGTYTVTVRAFSVPSGPQPFALVVTGAVSTGAGGNQPPVANAGADQSGQIGTQVVLDGTGSSDPDGGPSPLGFAWTQTAGPAVTLSGAATSQARFTPSAAGTYTFRLLVSDGAAEDDDTVTVVVAGGGPVVVFNDDFEQARGWTANPSGTDTATTGRWERGDPQATSDNGPKQLGTARSGTFDLVTGASAGASAGVNDIDGGTTSIRSPAITLPAGTITLSFAFYLAHGSNSSSADFLRVRVVGATNQVVFQELGTTSDDDAVWATRSVDISAFAGQSVRILVEAADAAGASLVEAAVDDVRIEAR